MWREMPFDSCIKKIKIPPKVPKKLYMETGDYPVVSQEAVHISGYYDDPSKVFRVEKPVVIFGDHTRTCKYVDFDFIVGADGVKVFLPDESINSKYFYYFILANTPKDKGYARHYRFLKQLTVPIPSLAEQKRIVERLDKAFAEIDKAITAAEAKEGEINSLTSSLLTSVLNTYLGQSETIALQNVCDFFGDGDWIETKDQAPEGLRLIQTGNIKVGSFADRKKNARYIDEETFKRLKCTEIFAGDLLVSRLPDPVGRACLIPELGERAITAVDCTIIRPKRDVVDAKYLNYYLQSNQYFENVQKVVTGATRQRISRKNLGQIPIIVPPLETQWEIVRRLNRVSEKVETLNAANSQSQAAYPKLKAAILKQELTPSEPV